MEGSSELAASIGTSEVLGEIQDIKVQHPRKQAILLSEGIHLEVINTVDDREWRIKDVRELLKEAFFALPVAKMIAEGRFTEEFWTNIHLNSYPGFDKGWNVFGRNPKSETGWGKPVSIQEVSESDLPLDQKEKLKETFSRYLPLWEKEIDKIRVFGEGIKPVDRQSAEFDELSSKLKDPLIWANDKFELVIVREPHLSGLHLVVHPREQLKRPWQKPEDFLEAAAILLGVQRLLEEGNLPFYNPEIHFSGNWAKDLLLKEKGGKLNTSYLSSEDLVKQRKAEKRKHRIGTQEQWETSTHGHLYATHDPKAFVSLPSRPKAEVPGQWERIRPLDENDSQRVRDLIGNNLTSWLKKSATGRL